MEKKRDLNAIIGFFLIGLILVWFAFANNGQEAQSLEATATEVAATDSATSKSTAQPEELVPAVQLDSNFTPATEPVVLENNKLRLTFNPQGAQIVGAEIKGYQTYDSLPLNLIDQNNSLRMVWQEGGATLGSDQLPYAVREEKLNEGQKLVFTTQAADGNELEISYLLPTDKYQLEVEINRAGWAGMNAPEVQWEFKAHQFEQNRSNEQLTTELYFYSNEEEDYDYLSGAQDEETAKQLGWIAYKQQFFSSILSLEGGIGEARMAVQNEEDGRIIKSFGSQFKLPSDQTQYTFHWYLGPNKFEILQNYEKEYETLIPLGWGIFGWISRGVVLPIFNWLEDYGMNYGLIILIMAFLIKMVLLPLTYKSYLSMAKMRVLRPEIEEVQAKHKDKDPMKAQQAMMELYRKAGVSPLGGCVPMLLQFPILIAMFRFFPSSIELRQQSFLWANDLSTYDSIYNLPFEIPFYGDHVSLFTLLMTISTLLYTWFNNQLTGAASGQMAQMKWMMYLMPIVFLGVFNNYASGLSYYYFIANMLTFGQQALIRAFVDDNAIHAKIQENKQREVKPNRIQRRLEDLAKQQTKKK